MLMAGTSRRQKPSGLKLSTVPGSPAKIPDGQFGAGTAAASERSCSFSVARGCGGLRESEFVANYLVAGYGRDGSVLQKKNPTKQPQPYKEQAGGQLGALRLGELARPH